MGDDLGSDDEQWMMGLAAPEGAVSDSDEETAQPNSHNAKNDRKRKQPDDGQGLGGSTNKSKKRQTPDRLIIEAGRNIEQQTAEEQASFLNIVVKHYSLLENDAVDVESLKVLPRFLSMPKGMNMTERIRESLSMKKLKKWKRTKSPMACIVCLSARRAVEILKELSSLKIRVAKLFPKSGSIHEQREQLDSTPFGLVVGTPHRLAALAGCGDVEASLNFNHTQLIVFDTHLNNKQYSVVSLPDTAPHCSTLIREKILPQLKKRPDIRLAFF